MSTEVRGEPFESWAILELMGHRRLGGFVREQEIAGHGFLRIDIPGPDGNGAAATQFYSPSSVYALTPTSEETARMVARVSQPAPVTRWELPPPATTFHCPYCGITTRHVCSECGEDHPCSCMETDNPQRSDQGDHNDDMGGPH